MFGGEKDEEEDGTQGGDIEERWDPKLHVHCGTESVMNQHKVWLRSQSLANTCTLFSIDLSVSSHYSEPPWRPGTMGKSYLLTASHTSYY